MADLVTKAQFKLERYFGLVRSIRNWPQYLLWKSTSKERLFTFDVRGIGPVRVEGREFGPFRENLLNDVYYSALPAHVLARLGEEPTVLDVGANAGHFALATFKRFPAARVVSFEPLPFCQQQLERRQGGLPNFDWTVDGRALADRDGEAELHVDVLDAYTSISGLGTIKGNNNVVTITTCTLDAALARHDLDKVDFAKFDCEGGEYPTLLNASKDALSRINAFVIETHHSDVPGYNHKALHDFLEDSGFRTNRDFPDTREALLVAWRDS